MNGGEVSPGRCFERFRVDVGNERTPTAVAVTFHVLPVSRLRPPHLEDNKKPVWDLQGAPRVRNH